MRLVELEPGYRTMPTAVFYPGDGGARAATPPCEFGRAAIAAYVDGIDGRLMRSMKSILGSSLVEQTTDVGGGRGVRYLDVVADLPGAPEALRRGRRPARRSAARCSAGRCSSSTTTPSATPRPKRRCAAPPRAPAFARSSSSTSRSPPRSTTSRRCAREEKVLVADIGGGTSDFSVVRVGPGRERAGSSARTTSSPTTASTSPAPISTGGSSWRACCRCFGYGAFGAEHRRRAGARGAERGLLRPRDLAPDQHRLQPAARGRAARHALVLRRPGASIGG